MTFKGAWLSLASALAVLLVTLLFLPCACTPYRGTSLLPGPGEQGYDPVLENKARRYDRQHLVFNCAGNGINSDVVVSLEHPQDRRAIAEFLDQTDGWDFEEWSGRGLFDVIAEYQPVAGLYAGVGIAADAYRYGTLRDRGYPDDEVDRARRFLLRDIEALFVAIEITGTPGVIARGFNRTDIPSSSRNEQTTPLFDEQGNPLPPEKNNGTVRADNSADRRYPNYIWIDSCSRDQFIGWAAAFAALWEVIKTDPTFDDDIKARLQGYASLIGRSLMVERTGGIGSNGQAFDLEILDADGRTTYHGYLNENNWDRVYLAWLPIKNGMYALMSLGIVAALAYCSEDPVLEEYLYETLIGRRQLDRIAEGNQLGVNLGLITNFSATNMAFQGALLAQRYIDSAKVRNRVRYATAVLLYPNIPPLLTRQPEEYAYSLFDFTYAAALSGASAFNPMVQAPDQAAIERGIRTLYDFREPPYWDEPVTNCDEEEIASGVCTLDDGTVVTVLGNAGRNNDLITREPIPHAVRPPSNYHWRSNPYVPNGGGDGSRLLPGVDFRYAYWYARWVR